MTREQAGDRLQAAQIAVAHLKAARIELRKAGSKNAADYAARALKSAEGAARHAQRLLGEAQRAESDAALDDFNYVGSRHHY